jgi:hypothetical protein
VRWSPRRDLWRLGDCDRIGSINQQHPANWSSLKPPLGYKLAYPAAAYAQQLRRFAACDKRPLVFFGHCNTSENILASM